MTRWHVWREERALVIVGLALCVAGALVQAAIWLRGTALVPPEGDLSRAVSFDIAVGMFVLTTALILPLASLSARARRRFRAVVFTFSAYGLVIENLQHARGLDPRFSSFGGIVDTVSGITFGVLAIAIVAGYGYLTVHFFRDGSTARCPALLRLSIQYGLVTTALGLLSGVWMSVLQGRYFGESANIIWLHGFGFHGVQAVPLIAWLLLTASGDTRQGARIVHIGGSAWAACIVFTGLQTLLGRDLYAWEPLPILALAAAAVWAGVAAKALSDRIRRHDRTRRLDKPASHGSPGY